MDIFSKLSDGYGVQWQFEDLRPFSDFIWGSARYSMPNYRDLKQWDRRIYQNLMYYQSNYLLMALLMIVFFLIGNFHKTMIICLMLIMVCAMGILMGAKSEYNYKEPRNKIFAEIVQLRDQLIPTESTRPTVFWASVGIAILTLYFAEVILSMILMILLPIFTAFVHASFRMRNIKNRVTNIVYKKMRQTPMGIILPWLLLSFDRDETQSN